MDCVHPGVGKSTVLREIMLGSKIKDQQSTEGVTNQVFTMGSLVLIHGLKHSTQYNGCRGKVAFCFFHTHKTWQLEANQFATRKVIMSKSCDERERLRVEGRLQVDLDMGHAVVNVKSNNLVKVGSSKARKIQIRLLMQRHEQKLTEESMLKDKMLACVMAFHPRLGAKCTVPCNIADVFSDHINPL
jgi:hypothetical protein